MSRIHSRLHWLVVIAALFNTVYRADAWQTPDELPSAPRITVDDAVAIGGGDDASQSPERIIDHESGAAGVFSVIHPSSAPAPAIVPVEEIIAGPTTIAPTARRNGAGSNVTTAPALKPGPDTAIPRVAQQARATPLKATLFKQAEPGVTTAEGLIELWGEPRSKSAAGEATTWTFAVAPFSRVDANIAAGIVQSIVIHFNAPADANATSTQLGLAAISPVDFVDATGKLASRNFPERGVTFLYDAQADATKIAQLRLAPISAGDFLTRVHTDRENRWTKNLADLEIAASLSPNDERIHWLRSELLMQQCEYRQAALAIEKSLQAKPESHLYQLTAAKLIAHAGNYEDAIAATSQVIQNETLPSLIKGKAALQLGDMLAESPRRDFAKALEYHQYAIQAAVPLATHGQSDVRMAAKQLLIDAHAAIAGDIAQGRWQNKAKSVPQWADRGQALVDEYIENENGSVLVKLEIICKRLAAYAWLEGQVDPTDAVAQLDAALTAVRASATDALFIRHIQWQFSKAMIDAVDIERARGNPNKALEYGKIAEQAIASIAKGQWQMESTQFQLSRLYFLLGSVQALHREDHAAAAAWFDKAIDDIARPEPDQDLTKTARRGHWLVSMGVSYWHSGQKEDALRLTQVGVGLIEKAQVAGAAKDNALAAPYNNLAFMHEQLGNDDKAKEFAALAEKHPTTRQR